MHIAQEITEVEEEKVKASHLSGKRHIHEGNAQKTVLRKLTLECMQNTLDDHQKVLIAQNILINLHELVELPNIKKVLRKETLIEEDHFRDNR